MPSLRAYLQTRIARRVFGLFLLCAVVPAVTLAASGYWLVSKEMRSQAGAQLAQASKISGTLLLARLHAADEALLVARTTIGDHPATALGKHTRLRGLLRVTGNEVEVLWGGPTAPLPRISKDVSEHLRRGRPAVVMSTDQRNSRIYLVRNLSGDGAPEDRLWAELSPDFLWGDSETESVAPAGVDLCVFGSQSSTPIYCSPGAGEMAAHAGGWQQGNTSQIITSRQQEVVAGSSTVFLGFEFGADAWTVVLEQPLVAMSKGREFGRTVILTLIIGLCLVTLASNVLLRHSLDPVARLQAGTRRLAEGDFSAPVEVSTGDEFEDLAKSFNTMATGLREQFGLLAALQAVDREALTAHSDAGIIAAGIQRLSELASRRHEVIVAVARRSREVSPLTVWRTSAAGTLVREETRVPSSDLDALGELAPASELAADDFRSGILDALKIDRAGGCLVLPLLEHRISFGVVALTRAPGDLRPFSSYETDRLRQLVDQMALALSHCLVLERLSALSWGTLQALARTIDASSPWTAGHSERVTRVAMAIGRRMQLGEEEIERLHRGGLLHDVGKIGIPSAVLDKPGSLDPDELAIVRAHPEVGARILQPIHAYEDVIGIVRHHHERFDGEGYPDRLAGARIPFLARVLAVADVYDALVSHRPYRAGWVPDVAISHIAERAGSHFDPNVVKAFLELVEGEQWAAATGADPLESRPQLAGLGVEANGWQNEYEA
jgi:putative nucleotidyltransferase with HDIG domain